MDDLRKQIFYDLCVTPLTVFPTAIGATFLLLAFAGLGGTAAFLGFICLLVGFGSLVTNLIFNLNAVSERAVQKWRKQQKAQRNAELDTLDSQLARTKGASDEIALRNLRALYSSFTKDFGDKKIAKNVPATMLAQIDEIFEACIHNLRTSAAIYDQMDKITGDLKKTLKGQRDQLIKDVEGGVETLAGVINEVRALGLNADRRSLQKIQTRLTSQLNIAKATEKAVASLDEELEEDLENETTEMLTRLVKIRGFLWT